MSTTNQQLLKKYGYQVVALPRTDIKPLHLLSRHNNDLELLEGDIKMLFEADEQPIPTTTRKTASISDQLTIAGDIGGSADVLGGIFSMMKLTDSALKAGLQGGWNRHANIVIDNILEDNVKLIQLDGFLTGALPLEGKFRTFEQQLRNSELYVVTGTLSSDAFTIELNDGSNINGELKTKLEQLVDISSNISRKKEGSYTMKSTTGEPLVFAYRAARIHYDDKKWWEFWKSEEAGFRLVKERGRILRSADEDVQHKDDIDVDFLETPNGISNI